jgi:hypothetical protein
MTNMTKEEAANIGIKETKEVAELVSEVVKGFIAARKDGKWDAADIGYLLPVFGKLGPALENFAAVGTEIKDLDAAEISSIAATLLSGVVLEEGKMKIYIEEGLQVVISVFKIIKAK